MNETLLFKHAPPIGPVHPSPPCSRSSIDETAARFDTRRSAAKYALAHVDTSMHRRECACIRAALSGLPKGSRVLDLPSGTGRLFSTWLEMGFRVTGADSSAHMIEQAKLKLERDQMPEDRVDLRVLNARDTTLPDDAFDAVVCNRLFHHIRETHERRIILRELSRICRGRLVISFFNKMALDSLIFSVKNACRGIEPTDRIPIWANAFADDVRSVGRSVQRFLPVRPLISKQCYAVVSPA